MDSLSVLILLNIPDFKTKTILKILNSYTNIPLNEVKLIDLFENFNNIYNSIIVPSSKTIKVAISQAQKIIKECSLSGIFIMNYSEKVFPQKLKMIPYPPLLLYYKGNIKYINEQYCVAIIGSRSPSINGEMISKKLGIMFALKGFTIVSGLALGCDTFGHLGCLEKSGNNIAILPCGLNNIYPLENIKLADKIIKNGGCLISEYPPNTKLKPQYFVLRDRLQSGLASAVMVIESKTNGGTMHTAKFAIVQNKILICISPNLLGGINSSNSGNIHLIENKMAISLKSFPEVDLLIEDILNNSLIPIFKTKRKEQLKYEQLKFKL